MNIFLESLSKEVTTTKLYPIAALRQITKVDERLEKRYIN